MKKETNSDKYLAKRNFKVIRELGSGTDGIVQHIKHTKSNKDFAFKIVNLQSEINRTLFNSEKKIMKKIGKYKHPHIITTYKFHENKKAGEGYILMEKLDTDLWEQMAITQKALKEEEVKKIIKQVCKALEFLHAHNIAHLDIKLDNILLKNADHSIKLCDFVRSYRWEGRKGIKVGQNIGRRITREYRANEISHETEYRVDRLDQWSVGIVLYFLLTRAFPHDPIYDKFVDYNEEVFVDIRTKEDYLKNVIGVSDDCYQFLCILLNRDASLRPSFTTLLQHPFLT